MSPFSGDYDIIVSVHLRTMKHVLGAMATIVCTVCIYIYIHVYADCERDPINVSHPPLPPPILALG